MPTFSFIYHRKPYLVNPGAQYGLGLLLLATYARDLGAEVQVLDWQCRTDDTVPDVQGHIVCLSGCLIDKPEIMWLARYLRNRGHFVAIGGPVARSLPPVEGTGFGIQLCPGPGEGIIRSLVLGDNQPWERTSFESCPFADRSLLPDTPGGNVFRPVLAPASRSSTLMTARGCNRTCPFCTSSSHSRYDYSLKRIEAELQHLAGLGIEALRINDDNFLAGPSGRSVRIMELLKSFGMRWRASVCATSLTHDLAAQMADSGCEEVSVGVESGDPAVRRALLKPGDSSDTICQTLDAGLPVRLLMMMSTPGETEATLGLNQRFVEKFPDAMVCLTVFYPFPGTPIAEDPYAFGCRIETSSTPNIYLFRPESEPEPEANIAITRGMTRDQLTANLRAMKQYLIDSGQANPG